MRLQIPDFYRSQVFRNPIKHHNFSSLEVVLLILEMMHLINKGASTVQNTFMGSPQGPVLGRTFWRERKACRVWSQTDWIALLFVIPVDLEQAVCLQFLQLEMCQLSRFLWRFQEMVLIQYQAHSASSLPPALPLVPERCRWDRNGQSFGVPLRIDNLELGSAGNSVGSSEFSAKPWRGQSYLSL